MQGFILNSTLELIALMRWFHQQPALPFKEQKTSAYIVSYLKSIGVTNIKIEAGTGVVCEIGSDSKVGACRFNMDGLPIPEKVESSFKSTLNGYSYSCGHDFELAWGLTIAKYFSEHPPQNTLKLMFQPAEEEPGEEPLGRTVGKVYADTGVFNVDAIFSLHGAPEVELGTVSIIDGDVTCAAYDFEIILQGKSGHAAKPHLVINPVYYASKLIEDLYLLEEEIKALFKDDDGFVVITTSFFQTRIDKDSVSNEESQNTIPEFVFVKGISSVWSKDATERLLKGFEIISKKYTNLVSLKMNLVKIAPATLNDTKLVSFVQETCVENQIKLLSKRTTWRDDAGWGSEKAPTAHSFFGIGGAESSLNSPNFNADESGLQTGLTVFLNSLDKFLNN